MKEFDNNDCLTCDHTREYGYNAFICIHPNLPKKYKKREIMVGKRGHPNFCPLAKSIMKEINRKR